MFTKWPTVYVVLDPKMERITKLFSEEMVLFFSILEALLSDRGTDLLSHLVLDVSG